MDAHHHILKVFIYVVSWLCLGYHFKTSNILASLEAYEMRVVVGNHNSGGEISVFVTTTELMILYFKLSLC